jgi:hypothetical protein
MFTFNCLENVSVRSFYSASTSIMHRDSILAMVSPVPPPPNHRFANRISFTVVILTKLT